MAIRIVTTLQQTFENTRRANLKLTKGKPLHTHTHKLSRADQEHTHTDVTPERALGIGAQRNVLQARSERHTRSEGGAGDA